MKFVYSLPHPTDHLDFERAGHIVRAKCLLSALERAGHPVLRVQAARSISNSGTAAAVYRRLVRRMLPKPLALRLRDAGRVRYGKIFAKRLAAEVASARPDVILETHVGFSLAGAIAAEQTGVPFVVDDFSPPHEEGTAFGEGNGSTRAAEFVLRRVVEQASLLIAVSDHVRDFLADMGVPEEKIGLLPNGFDGDAFNTRTDGMIRRRQLGLDPDARAIAYVGSFLPFHRVDLLIESFAALAAAHPIHLILVGEGPEVVTAQARLRNHGLLHRAHFVGRVPNSDVAGYVAASDIAVLPGALDFGNSMKLFEYMALGRPTVAPDLPAVASVVEDGKHALLFADGDESSLRQRLLTLLLQPELLARLSRNSAQWAANHTWAARTKTLVHMLRDRCIVTA
jgi:glycosyltransferase involved in cell wall biosynthesis